MQRFMEMHMLTVMHGFKKPCECENLIEKPYIFT